MGRETGPGSAGRGLIGNGVRPPAAAGSFYPADARRLAAAVDELLREARTDRAGARPVALVVPHAGYRYSGPVAASAYELLRPAPPLRVAIAGPAHYVPLRGCAVPTAGVWRTSLGDVAVDERLKDAAVAAGADPDDRPHRPEHAIEVQLPFLQRIAGEGLRILPIAVGLVDTGWVADLLLAVLPVSDLLIVSTDLSHYLDDPTAKLVDRRTADAIVARDPSALAEGSACGVHALRGLVELARREDLAVYELDLRTSADTAGDPRRVVGYGAFALERPDRFPSG